MNKGCILPSHSHLGTYCPGGADAAAAEEYGRSQGEHWWCSETHQPLPSHKLSLWLTCHCGKVGMSLRGLQKGNTRARSYINAEGGRERARERAKLTLPDLPSCNAMMLHAHINEGPIGIRKSVAPTPFTSLSLIRLRPTTVDTGWSHIITPDNIFFIIPTVKPDESQPCL